MEPQVQIKKSNSKSFTGRFTNRDIANCFVGSIVKRGNRQKAINFFSYLLYSIRRAHSVDSFRFLRGVLEGARPKIFLSSKKIAGVVHKIPTPITVRKSYSIIIHWIVLSAKKRTESHKFGQALFDEINDIYRNPTNQTLRKRDEFHKLAYINKPFLRYYKF